VKSENIINVASQIFVAGVLDHNRKLLSEIDSAVAISIKAADYSENSSILCLEPQ